MNVKYILPIFFSILFSACINLSTEPVNGLTNQEVIPKINIDQKVISLRLLYSIKQSGNLDKNKSNTANIYLENATMNLLETEFKVKSAHGGLTKYQEVVLSEQKDDYIFTFEIEEDNEDPENVLQMIFRGLSFGFYQQKMIKNMSYNLKILQLASGETFSTGLRAKYYYYYQAPMLVIPFNLDNHPFSAMKQMDKHLDEIRKLIKASVE